MLIPRFIAAIHNCKQISETGASQLLLDSYNVKALLLEVPVVSCKGRQMPAAYSNYVVREMGKVEAVLKVHNY